MNPASSSLSEAGRAVRCRGLSLVEVMIALFVLAVGILPIFYVFSQGNLGAMMTRDEIMAHSYAAEIIDFGHAVGFDGMTHAEYPDKEVKSIPGGAEVDSRFRRYLNVVERSPEQGLTDWPIEYRILQARVTWNSSGIEKSFALTSLLFRGRTK